LEGGERAAAERLKMATATILTHKEGMMGKAFLKVAKAYFWNIEGLNHDIDFSIKVS